MFSVTCPGRVPNQGKEGHLCSRRNVETFVLFLKSFFLLKVNEKKLLLKNLLSLAQHAGKKGQHFSSAFSQATQALQLCNVGASKTSRK